MYSVIDTALPWRNLLPSEGKRLAQNKGLIALRAAGLEMYNQYFVIQEEAGFRKALKKRWGQNGAVGDECHSAGRDGRGSLSSKGSERGSLFRAGEKPMCPVHGDVFASTVPLVKSPNFSAHGFEIRKLLSPPTIFLKV